MRRIWMPLVALIAASVLAVFTGEAYAMQDQQQQQDQRMQQQQDSIVGTVSEQQNGGLTIETEEGETRSFQLDEQTRFLDEQGQAQQEDAREALQAGDRVVLHYTEENGEDQPRVISIRKTEQQTERQGQQYQQDQQRQQQQQDQQQQQQAQQRQQQGVDSIVGTVLQPQNGGFAVRDEQGRRMVFEIQNQTRVLDEMGRMQEQEALEELNPGDRVVVHYRAEDEEIQRTAISVRRHDPTRTDQQRQQQDQQRQQQEEELDSIVATVTEPQNGGLAVRDEQGRQMVFQVDDQTRVLNEMGQREQREALEALNPGDRVVIRYRSDDQETQRTAVSIQKQERDDGMQESQPQLLQQDRQQNQGSQLQNQQENQQQNQGELPATGSSAPLVALLGVLGLATAFGIQRRGAQRNR